MAGVLAEIHQVSALLHATNNPFSKSLGQDHYYYVFFSLLPVLFSDFKHSNVADLSKSDLPIVASTDLDITIEALNFSISLSLKISILAFSSSIYISSLPDKLFLFLNFYLFVSLADKSSPPLLFSFSNLCFLPARPSFWFCFRSDSRTLFHLFSYFQVP